MESTKELFNSILEEWLGGKYQEIFTPDKASELVRQITKIGRGKTNLNTVCDGNILASLISTILIGNLLSSLQMPDDLVPSAISIFIDTYPDSMYFIIGCLALASEMGLNFDGEELDVETNEKSEWHGDSEE